MNDARRTLPKAYLRIDPNLDQHADPEGMLLLICAAHRQRTRGVFLDEAALVRILGSKKRARQFMEPRAGDRRPDVQRRPDGTLYLDGWDEWQEGDFTVGERVARLRARRNETVTPTVTSTVTEPLPAPFHKPLPPSEAGGGGRNTTTPTSARRAGAGAREDVPPPEDQDRQLDEVDAILDRLQGWDFDRATELRRASQMPPKGSRPARWATSASELTGRWREVTLDALRRRLTEAEELATVRQVIRAADPPAPEPDPEADAAWTQVLDELTLAERAGVKPSISPQAIAAWLRPLKGVQLEPPFAIEGRDGDRMAGFGKLLLACPSIEHFQRVASTYDRAISAAAERIHVRVELSLGSSRALLSHPLIEQRSEPGQQAQEVNP